MTFINFIVILKLITNEYEIGEKMNRLSSIKNKKENNKNKPKIKISRLFKLLSLLILIIIILYLITTRIYKKFSKNNSTVVTYSSEIKYDIIKW